MASVSWEISRFARMLAGETGRVYVSGTAIGGEETTVSTWLGYAFEQPVAVRCVIICQSEDIATRAETAFLERSHDGECWIPHATLALSAAANVIQANPCKLKYESEDLDQKRKKAYHRSAGALGGHIRLLAPTQHVMPS